MALRKCYLDASSGFLLKLLTGIFLVLAVITNSQAHSKKIESGVEDHSQHASPGGEISMAEITLPDGLSMLNQFGEKVLLKENVIGDRIVVIDFVYTNCETVCPVVS